MKSIAVALFAIAFALALGNPSSARAGFISGTMVVDSGYWNGKIQLSGGGFTPVFLNLATAPDNLKKITWGIDYSDTGMIKLTFTYPKPFQVFANGNVGWGTGMYSGINSSPYSLSILDNEGFAAISGIAPTDSSGRIDFSQFQARSLSYDVISMAVNGNSDIGGYSMRASAVPAPPGIVLATSGAMMLVVVWCIRRWYEFRGRLSTVQ